MVYNIIRNMKTNLNQLDTFRVVDSLTGEVKSYKTTLEKAEAQVRLLRYLDNLPKVRRFN